MVPTFVVAKEAIIDITMQGLVPGLEWADEDMRALPRGVSAATPGGVVAVALAGAVICVLR